MHGREVSQHPDRMANGSIAARLLVAATKVRFPELDE